jgi:murein L,D-transpeptidase YcbB/YkuD
MARLAPSLVRARAVIDARWPGRDRTSDGWIGDAAHQGRTSDHNPNVRGVVDAIDVDTVAVPGTVQVHVPSVLAGMMVHPATHYVINRRRIFRSEDQFRPRLYDGINPHTGHAHLSIRQTVGAENDPTPWTLLAHLPLWPTLREGDTGRAARELQAYLNAHGAALAVDGNLGPASGAAIRAFQRARGLTPDGIVGAYTRAKIFA